MYRSVLSVLVTSLLAATAMAEEASRLEAFEAHYNGLAEASASYQALLELPQARMKNRTAQQLRMRRPNHVVIKTTEGRRGGTLLSDGTKLYQGIPDIKRYTLEDAPESFEKWVSADLKKRRAMPAPGGDIVLQLLGGAPLKSLVASPTEVLLDGQEEISGKACDRFMIKTPDRTVSLWIGKEDPWLWRFRSDAGTVKIDLVFEGWEARVKGDDVFAIRPPEGMNKVDELFPPRGAQARQQRQPARKAGAKAVTFEAELLGGGDLNLDDHLGKNIIVLDFWATWCKPCLMAMPIIAEETAARKDKGVVFLSVNLREADAKVQRLMDQKGWKFPVVMDRRAEIGQRYGVSGIPHSVIIGKDGTIKHVHVGFSPALREQLSSELDALIAE